MRPALTLLFSHREGVQKVLSSGSMAYVSVVRVATEAAALDALVRRQHETPKHRIKDQVSLVETALMANARAFSETGPANHVRGRPCEGSEQR